MSLVTRCTACGTLFKVVADQLKISQGWVRCGQCAHVFDAQANLVEPELDPRFAAPRIVQTQPKQPEAFKNSSIDTTDSIALGANSVSPIAMNNSESEPSAEELALLNEWQPQDSVQPKAKSVAATAPADMNGLMVRATAVSSSSSRAILGASPSPPPTSPEFYTPGRHISIAPDSRTFQPGKLRDSSDLDSEVGPSTASWVSSDYTGQGLDTSADRTAMDRSQISRSADMHLPSEPHSNFTTPDSPTTQPQPTPSFVKQAQRAARWRSPWVRFGLALLALFLLAGLALQVALREKDFIAATYPQAKPWLEQLCQHAACRVESVKRIEAIVIDSSSFNRISKNNPQLEANLQSYKLSVTLKNNGSLAVAAPHVELSLQDAQDQPVLRRVLSPADLGASRESLAPGQELVGSLTLQISTAQLAGSRINGYRVLAFYP